MNTQYDIAVAATGTDFHTHPSSPMCHGITHSIEVVVPNYTNDVTTTISIERTNGLIVYQSTALARNTKTEILVDRFTQPTDTIRATLSGAAGGSGGTVNVNVIMDV